MHIDDLEAKLDDLESEVYSEEAYDKATILWGQAEMLMVDVLEHFDLTYSNPGEPEACGTQRDGSEVKIPLTGGNASLYTMEEDERLLASDGEDNIPGALYWARLRAQQARDILDDGWQSGLVYNWALVRVVGFAVDDAYDTTKLGHADYWLDADNNLRAQMCHVENRAYHELWDTRLTSASCIWAYNMLVVPRDEWPREYKEVGNVE